MNKIVKEALTFDDVLLIPGASDFTPNMADLTTKLSKDITLNVPLISAAMDTVTEARLAIAIAPRGRDVKQAKIHTKICPLKRRLNR